MLILMSHAGSVRLESDGITGSGIAETEEERENVYEEIRRRLHEQVEPCIARDRRQCPPED